MTIPISAITTVVPYNHRLREEATYRGLAWRFASAVRNQPSKPIEIKPDKSHPTDCKIGLEEKTPSPIPKLADTRAKISGSTGAEVLVKSDNSVFCTSGELGIPKGPPEPANGSGEETLENGLDEPVPE